jgi:hypothetical protein
MIATKTKVLTKDDIRERASSVLTRKAADGLSENYRFYSTWSVVKNLTDRGWLPVSASQSRTLVKGNQGFARHMVRFRQEGYLDKSLITQEAVFPELVLINSHNGKSAYQLYVGLYRLVCSNGLIAQTQSFERVSLRHMGHTTGEIKKITTRYLSALPEVIGDIVQMQKVVLPEGGREVFAAAALELKYGDEPSPVAVETILHPRRKVDEGPTVWQVYNVLQENLISGGVIAGLLEKPRKTKEIKAIPEIVRVNTGLWNLAKGYANN